MNKRLDDLWSTFLLSLIIAFPASLAYIVGYEHGTPVFDITEIVWLETHNPIGLLDMECRMVPMERR